MKSVCSTEKFTVACHGCYVVLINVTDKIVLTTVYKNISARHVFQLAVRFFFIQYCAGKN